jgi:hypothetical protein
VNGALPELHVCIHVHASGIALSLLHVFFPAAVFIEDSPYISDILHNKTKQKV